LQKHASAAGEDAVGLRAMAGEQGQRIQTVLAQLQVLVDSAQHQNGQIAEIRDEQARLRSAHEQTSASVQRHGDAVRALGEELELAHRQQDERISRALEALQIIGDQLREQRTVLAQQNDALQSVTQRVERISRPWWKKLF
jgi:anion-transporting  ArsA/GET3 family ATPase